MCQELSDIMKRSWNSDGQQFHQYQQNEQSPLTLTHYTKKPLTYDIENTCSSLGQAQIKYFFYLTVYQTHVLLPELSKIVGQKLTRSDLNVFASDPMSGAIFQ
jgi:hypothetical protein